MKTPQTKKTRAIINLHNKSSWRHFSQKGLSLCLIESVSAGFPTHKDGNENRKELIHQSWCSWCVFMYQVHMCMSRLVPNPWCIHSPRLKVCFLHLCVLYVCMWWVGWGSGDMGSLLPLSGSWGLNPGCQSPSLAWNLPIQLGQLASDLPGIQLFLPSQCQG